MTEPTSKRPVVPSKPKLEKRRKSLTIRLPDEVRGELEACAVKYGRSLSEEVETRLVISLAQKTQLQVEWGDDLFRIAAAMGVARSQIEYWRGEDWLNDDRAALVFELTASMIVRNYRDIVQRRTRAPISPKGFDEMTDQELAEVFAAQSGLAAPRPRRAPVEVVYSDD
ncbi:hypothetical protein [Methylobacterium sp. D54C]